MIRLEIVNDENPDLPDYVEGVSRQVAEAVLATVTQAFAYRIEPGYGPELVVWEDNDYSRRCWAVAWEEGSPDEWVYRLFDLMFAGTVKMPGGVLYEAIFGFVLGIYENGDE